MERENNLEEETVYTDSERVRRKKEVSYFDFSLLFVIIFLICFGCLMLYSASSYVALIRDNDSFAYLKKQVFAAILGAFAMAFLIKVDYTIWRKYAAKIYYLSIGTVLLVLTPLGIYVNGAKRWVDLKIISFQPAEFVKLAVIISLAHVISANYKKLGKIREIVFILLYAIIASFIVAAVTRNLSSAIIIMGIAVVMLFIASPLTMVFLGIGAAAVVAVAIYILVTAMLGDAYRTDRIQVWFHPEDSSQEVGYQILQGLYAIGSGGLMGKGLGQSVQKMGFLPEAQNDYIFTIICEELGLIGALAIIFLFAFVIRRMAVIAANAKDLFGSMLVVGVMAHISIQVVLNIAVVTNSIPNTGVTLPFISYGGTSMLFLMSEVGLVFSVSKRIKRMR